MAEKARESQQRGGREIEREMGEAVFLRTPTALTQEQLRLRP